MSLVLLMWPGSAGYTGPALIPLIVFPSSYILRAFPWVLKAGWITLSFSRTKLCGVFCFVLFLKCEGFFGGLFYCRVESTSVKGLVQSRLWFLLAFLFSLSVVVCQMAQASWWIGFLFLRPVGQMNANLNWNLFCISNGKPRHAATWWNVSMGLWSQTSCSFPRSAHGSYSSLHLPQTLTALRWVKCMIVCKQEIYITFTSISSKTHYSLQAEHIQGSSIHTCWIK